MGICTGSLDGITRSPRFIDSKFRDGFPSEFESVRSMLSAIFPGRMSAFVIATSISLQQERSIEEPRFWYASISKGAKSDERTLTSVDFP